MTIQVSALNLTQVVKLAIRRSTINLRKKREARRELRRLNREPRPRSRIDMVDIILEELKLENLLIASNIELFSITRKGQDLELKSKLERIRKYRDNKEIILKILAEKNRRKIETN